MAKTNKLQELVSNSIAQAMETATNSSKGTKGSSTKSTNNKKETKTSKVTPISAKEEVTKEVTKQQKSAIIEQVISNREVKYIYPEDIVDTLSRKSWRQATRKKLHKLERDMLRIQDHNSKEYKEAFKAYEDYKATVLKPAQTA